MIKICFLSNFGIKPEAKKSRIISSGAERTSGKASTVGTSSTHGSSLHSKASTAYAIRKEIAKKYSVRKFANYKQVKPSTSGLSGPISRSKSPTTKKSVRKFETTESKVGKTLNKKLDLGTSRSNEHEDSEEDADEKIDDSEYFESINSKLTPMDGDGLNSEPSKNNPKFKQSTQMKNTNELVRWKKLALPLMFGSGRLNEAKKSELSSSSSSLMMLDDDTTNNEESAADYSAGTSSREMGSFNSSNNHAFKLNSPKNLSHERNEDESMQNKANETNHDYFDELNNKSGSLLSVNSYDITKNNSDTISFINQSHLSPPLKKC